MKILPCSSECGTDDSPDRQTAQRKTVEQAGSFREPFLLMGFEVAVDYGRARSPIGGKAIIDNQLHRWYFLEE
jgi:hypothetical protein